MKELGKKLREARIAKKIELETIYEDTRVTVSTIQSIEQGEIGDLPMTYYRAFVRTLAAEVGLDGDALLRELDERSKQKTEDEIEGVLQKRIFLKTVFKNHQRAIVAGLIGFCFVILIALYIIFGHDLFYEPKISDIPQVSLPTDTVKTGPFTLKVFALGDSWIEVQVDSGNMEKNFLKKGDERKWDVSRIFCLGMDDPRSVLIQVNENQLIEAIQDTLRGLNLWIEASGVVRQEVRMNRIAPIKSEETKKTEPVLLVGHIEENVLYQKESIFKTNRDRYQPDPEILDKIRVFQPSVSLVCFLGTWDPVSRDVVPEMLKAIDELNIPGVTLSIIGINRQFTDKSGLIDFYQVQGVPTLIFLSRGKELGRIVGQPTERVENLFLNIIRKGESF